MSGTVTGGVGEGKGFAGRSMGPLGHAASRSMGTEEQIKGDSV
jgi:hypothetical protein